MLPRSLIEFRRTAFIATLLTLGAYLILTILLGGLQPNRLAILLDFLLLLAGLAFWTFFFAQFTLPVGQPRERLRIAFRLLLFLLGLHGPAQRIENGKLVQPDADSPSRGSGILVVDAASAAVLRTGQTFTRAVGPGIHFLHYDRRRSGEYVAGVVDLRPQVRAVGPAPREDPFAPRYRQETPDQYQSRQDRRWETSGLTRDGIEVVPTLSITFRIEGKPGEPSSFNALSVWRAVTAEGSDPSANATERSVSWEWLPSRLVVDAWRETLRMFTLAELFVDSASGHTGIEMIADMLRKRLTQAKAYELDEFGRSTGRQVVSPEFNLLVRRGLLVTSVSIVSLRLPLKVEEELARRWESTWLVRARQERESLQYQQSQAAESGKLQALRDYSLAIADDLNQHPASARPPELAGSLVNSSLRLLAHTPDLGRQASTEKIALAQLLARLHYNSSEEDHL